MRDPVPKKKVESNRHNHPTTGDRVRRQHRDRDSERQKKTQTGGTQKATDSGLLFLSSFKN